MRDLQPGYYWVKVQIGEGEPPGKWEPARYEDGPNWWVTGDDIVAYVAVVGPRIEPPED